MSTLVASRPVGWLAMPLFRWSLGIIGAVIAGIVIFELLQIPLFSRIGLPHEICYLQQPKLIWLHVTSDLLIGVAYVSISATLAYLVYRASRDIPFNWVFIAFGLFIVSCGLTHFMEVLVIWRPVYWLSGYVKVVTAAASVATAIALFPLVPKIFDLIAAARKSEQRRTEIEQLNEDLERFNYSVAHDLRAPLRSIVGFGDVLRDDHGAELSAEAAECVVRMQRAAGRMDALVSGLLRYATIGRQQLELRPVAVAEVVRGVMQLLEREISDRKAEIRVPDDLPTVIGDASLLQVALQNLIGNAIKFVAPGVNPQVQFSWRDESGYVVLCLTDNGVGFPPDSAKRVFGMFERFHPDQPGTGIGLAIAHRAIDRMQGQIGVEPGPEGIGSRFWLRLHKA
jgi:signal transduction histidine kinase